MIIKEEDFSEEVYRREVSGMIVGDEEKAFPQAIAGNKDEGLVVLKTSEDQGVVVDIYRRDVSVTMSIPECLRYHPATWSDPLPADKQIAVAVFKAAVNWEEDKHPRANDGKFAPKGEGESGGEESGRSQSVDAGGQSTGGKGPARFDVEKWAGIADMGQRKEEWAKIKDTERDRMANARVTVKKRQDELLGDAGKRPTTGDAWDDIDERLKQFSDRLPKVASAKIDEVAKTYHDVLKKAGFDEDAAYEMAMEAVDSLAAQDIESQRRQLGDHGIHHIGKNIETGAELLKLNPASQEDARDLAIMMTAQIWHDIGYMTPPSQNFLDEGHHRWSAQYFNEHIAPKLAGKFDKDEMQDIEVVIRTHDSQGIDWDNERIASAVRVADNTSLFQPEKMPAVFRYAPKNVGVLARLGRKEISLEDAQKEMDANVDGADVPDKVKERLHEAVKEVGGKTPKFTLGMLGGETKSIAWEEDHPVFILKERPDLTELHKVQDLGQAQFGKLASTYGIDPKQFTESLEFEFVNPKTGKVVLEGRIAKPGDKKGKSCWAMFVKAWKGSGDAS